MASTKKSGGKRSYSFTEYGYFPDGDAAPPEYLARITSLKNKCSIIGLLQQDIQLRIESRWDNFIPTTMLAKFGALAQAATGGSKSLVSKATSRRMWVGTTPIAINLKLRFEAIQDAFHDVVEPIRILQSLALPSEGSGYADSDVSAGSALTAFAGNPGMDTAGKVLDSLPLLSPPGPSPFSWEGFGSSRKQVNEANITSILEGMKGGDRILLQLGKFLRFDDVILREVTVNYNIKIDMFGDPTGAEVDLIFETYEIPTVQSLAKAYEKVDLRNDASVDGRQVTTSNFQEFHKTTFG